MTKKVPIKMTICRYSNMPIKKGDLEKFKKEYNEYYDKLVAEHGKFTQDNAALFQGPLKAYEEELKQKYPFEATVDFPDSPGKLKKLMKLYKNPIAFGLMKGKVTICILDAAEAAQV